MVSSIIRLINSIIRIKRISDRKINLIKSENDLFAIYLDDYSNNPDLFRLFLVQNNFKPELKISEYNKIISLFINSGAKNTDDLYVIGKQKYDWIDALNYKRILSQIMKHADKKSMSIKDVVPTDSWKLIFTFDNGENRILDYKDLDDKFGFLAYPNQLKAFSFSTECVTWKNGITLDVETIISHSCKVEKEDVENMNITIGQKNQAPTDQDSRHHVYFVSLYPFNANPITIGESIGGGHGERGGCSSFTFEKLKGIKDWKNHFKKSGCDWAIEPIDKDSWDSQDIINNLLIEIRNRSEFNK